jgi:hypothetical protein
VSIEALTCSGANGLCAAPFPQAGHGLNPHTWFARSYTLSLFSPPPRCGLFLRDGSRVIASLQFGRSKPKMVANAPWQTLGGCRRVIRVAWLKVHGEGNLGGYVTGVPAPFKGAPARVLSTISLPGQDQLVRFVLACCQSRAFTN